MKIAYLMNTYPMTSTTFIRREIEALERLGVEVSRFAVRQWEQQLVDPLDRAELRRTHYLMSGNIFALLLSVFQDIFQNTSGLLRGLAATMRLAQRAGGGWIRHSAYLLQAVYFRRSAARAGIVHVHAHFATNATTVALLSHVMGGPAYSFTMHGPDEFDETSRLSLDVKLAQSAFAIAISHYCRSQMLRFGGSEHAAKIKIVHCAVAAAEFIPAGLIEPGNQTLVCVGRLCRQKAQTMLPQIVRDLIAEFPNLKVILIGDGETRTEIENAIAAETVAAHFELRGWQSNEDVRAAIKEARALILPSFAEGLPIVIMEAFALGRPVVSTYIAGIPELVDPECGWLVPAGSKRHLRTALRDVLIATPEALGRKGAEGRRRILADFEPDQQARRLLSMIEGAVADLETGSDVRSSAPCAADAERNETASMKTSRRGKGVRQAATSE